MGKKEILTDEESLMREIKKQNKERLKRNDVEFRVGTFKEDIFSYPNDSYEFDVIFYYVKEKYPREYYYDNIDYKYNNTFETIAQHIASGNAEYTLLQLIDAMKMDECIFLCGLMEPLCTKKQLLNRIEEITNGESK